MKTSFFSKIFGGYFLVIFVLTASILFFTFRTVKTYYLESLTGNLKNLAVSLNLIVKPALEKGDELDGFAKELGRELNTRITVTDAGGNVVADSDMPLSEMENLKGRPEIAEALGGQVGKALRFSTILKEEMLYVAIPVKSGGKTIGALRVSLYLKDINSLLASLRNNIIPAVLVMTVLSLLMALAISRGLSKSIRYLADAAQKIAKGDFEARVELKNRDELKTLADSFNSMGLRIRTLFMELSCQKENLNSVISSIQEGLVVIDKEDRVVFSNDGFKAIAGGRAAEGKPYTEIISEPEFDGLVKAVKEEKRNIVKEIVLDGKYLLCSATFLRCFQQVVVILHDITEIRNLERMKKDFVANVSHELRTPLTAIKGFAETLLEEERSPEGRHYLDIVLKHTNRLMKIVSELLLLSKLEEEGVRLDLEKIDLKRLVLDVVRIFEPRLKEKGLGLRLDLEDGAPLVDADLFKLEQVLINLIDNAIKYTEKGEIGVSLRRSDRNVLVGIWDSGIGIPKEHLSRIFERFYIVGKSRSKKLGGTGLGLSIVKHIVLLHNGSIEVESIPGEGTKFTIILPCDPSGKALAATF